MPNKYIFAKIKNDDSSYYIMYLFTLVKSFNNLSLPTFNEDNTDFQPSPPNTNINYSDTGVINYNNQKISKIINASNTEIAIINNNLNINQSDFDSKNKSYDALLSDGFKGVESNMNSLFEHLDVMVKTYNNLDNKQFPYEKAFCTAYTEVKDAYTKVKDGYAEVQKADTDVDKAMVLLNNTKIELDKTTQNSEDNMNKLKEKIQNLEDNMNKLEMNKTQLANKIKGLKQNIVDNKQNIVDNKQNIYKYKFDNYYYKLSSYYYKLFTDLELNDAQINLNKTKRKLDDATEKKRIADNILAEISYSKYKTNCDKKFADAKNDAKNDANKLKKATDEYNDTSYKIKFARQNKLDADFILKDSASNYKKAINAFYTAKSNNQKAILACIQETAKLIECNQALEIIKKNLDSLKKEKESVETKFDNLKTDSIKLFELKFGTQLTNSTEWSTYFNNYTFDPQCFLLDDIKSADINIKIPNLDSENITLESKPDIIVINDMFKPSDIDISKCFKSCCIC